MKNKIERAKYQDLPVFRGFGPIPSYSSFPPDRKVIRVFYLLNTPQLLRVDVAALLQLSVVEVVNLKTHSFQFKEKGGNYPMPIPQNSSFPKAPLMYYVHLQMVITPPIVPCAPSDDL